MIKAKLNIAKLKSVIMTLKGKSGQPVKCLVIPIEENHLYHSDSTGAVYLELVGFESDKLKEWTHSVKQSLPKDLRDSMTKEEQNAYPFLGNFAVTGGQTNDAPVVSDEIAEVQAEEIIDELPF